jgi:hypothetical protein
MSSMLEQAIVDATALREAALKNAEQAIIEKYAPQIKEAVESLLEGNDSRIGVGSYVRHMESNQIGKVHSIDEDGVQIEGRNGRVFLAEMDELEEADMLHEEEMGGDAGASVATSAMPSAPMASSPSNIVDPNAQAELSMEFEFDPSDFEIDLDTVKAAAQEDPTSAGEQPEETEDLLGDLDLGGGDEGGDDLLGDLGGDEEELTLQEMMEMVSDILKEEAEDSEDEESEEESEEELNEELHVDLGEQKHGWITTDEGTRKYDEELRLAKQEGDMYKEENEELKESLRQTNKDTNKLLGVVEQLKAKLDEAMVANARLVYANKTLSDASLNERQKSKIVEAIAKATSVDEAKVLHETLSATVGSSSKSGPQSLSESVNRRSNLSAIMPRRKEPVVTESMSFADRMKKLAGIN